MEINFPDQNGYIRDINYMEKNTLNCWLITANLNGFWKKKDK
jgi:hypothetical protein